MKYIATDGAPKAIGPYSQAVVDGGFFFASHPRLEERIESYQDLLAGPYRGRTGGARNADVFRQKTLKAVIANGRLYELGQLLEGKTVTKISQ